jgi:hypothetical protein
MEDLVHQIDGSAWGSRARRMGAPPPPLGPARSCPPSNRERPHGDGAGLGEERVWLNLGSRFRPLAPYFARSLSILTRRQASVESLSEWGAAGRGGGDAARGGEAMDLGILGFTV